MLVMVMECSGAIGGRHPGCGGVGASFRFGHDPALPALCAVTFGNVGQLLLLGLSQGLGCAGVGLHPGQEAQTVLLLGGSDGTDALELLLHGHGGDRHGLFGL